MKIFLTPNLEQEDSKSGILNVVLQRAGFAMQAFNETERDVEILKKELINTIENSDCMILVLAPQYGLEIDDMGLDSFSRFAYKLGKEKSIKEEHFTFFIWHHPELLTNDSVDMLQKEFIKEIRYDLNPNMVFSSVSSPIQFVEDVRTISQRKEVKDYKVNETDVFLVFNEVDEEEAQEITEMLSDVLNIEKLNIIQESDTDYAELCSQQMKHSKLAVVYFKETAEWALPFTQQIWKKVGGAASHTPILFIGDEDPSTNIEKQFKAPKIVSLIVAGELLPLEIKMQYDKLINA